jgi:P-type Mg2+ transporter
MSETADSQLQTFWHLAKEDLLDHFNVHEESGLSRDEAKQKLSIYGYCTLNFKKKRSAFKLLLTQFNSPLIFLLFFCAILSMILYDATDAIIILGIILVSGTLSFFQERGALQAMEKLLKIVEIQATVIRQNEKQEIPLEEVVPGDIIELNAGDVIPGDCYLLESRNLFVDEATLTGETFYSEKTPGLLPEVTPISKRTNTLFMGTHVVSGTAKALVIFTGQNTEFGKISARLSFTPPETEFEHGIRHFGHLLMQVTFYLLLAILIFNIYLARPIIESLLFALALAVGLTPQLLPAIISINLAHGAKRMAENQVIVKRLASIENFGSMDILCCDKTGTLTSGCIRLENAYQIQGNPSEKVLEYAYLNASFQSGYTNPLDTAIIKSKPEKIDDWKKLDELPYDFNRKRIGILAQNKTESVLITKGAFQSIMDICTSAENPSGEVVDIQSVSKDLSSLFTKFSQDGFRVLGIAYKHMDTNQPLKPENETGMTFLGFLLFLDTPKDNIQNCIAELKALGIELKIITGDNKFMAQNLAKFLNIPQENVLTGPEILKMNDNALVHQVNEKSIFAEVEPNQKERIILALRKSGHVVGFLGDGINDVTALHAADVSITVNNAADAAKEVADIVLLDKDLSVLQEGVKAGRMTFANTLKYIFMATSANFGNMFSMAGASLFLSFLPLLPKQVLLTNLMEDFPEMTIATDNVDDEIVQKPLRWNIHFIRKFMIVFGLISSIFDYATFGLLLLLNASETEFRTGWFVESVVSAAFIVLIVRTFRPFYKSRPSPYLWGSVLLVIAATLLLPFTPIAPYLGFTTIPAQFYLFILLVIIFYMAFVEIAKKIFIKRWLR